MERCAIEEDQSDPTECSALYTWEQVLDHCRFVLEEHGRSDLFEYDKLEMLTFEEVKTRLRKDGYYLTRG